MYIMQTPRNVDMWHLQQRESQAGEHIQNVKQQILALQTLVLAAYEKLKLLYPACLFYQVSLSLWADLPHCCTSDLADMDSFKEMCLFVQKPVIMLWIWTAMDVFFISQVGELGIIFF